MSDTTSRSKIIHRRAELLAEFFLQDLGPRFLARPTSDLGYDSLAGFENARGGINNVAVQVKATEGPVKDGYTISRTLFNRWANSNIPVLLLVIDVKLNHLYHAVPSRDASVQVDSKVVRVPVSEINDRTREELLRILTL